MQLKPAVLWTPSLLRFDSAI